MRRLPALLAMLPLLVMAAVPAPSDVLPTRVEQGIHDRIAAGEYPAMVVAVVNGKKSHVYGFGKLTNGQAPDADTVFSIGSVTKTFTATLLAHAVQQNQLKLDEPVAKLLPGFTVPTHDGKFITLGNLATQHSGLPRLPGNLAPTDMQNPYADYDGKKLKTFLAGYTLPRDPGSSYEYSNLGVGLLGYALAQHAGMSYNALLQKQIFHPLGMNSSATSLNDAMRERLAQGHDASGKPADVWNLDALAGAGAIESTGGDMLRYLQANMGVTTTPLHAAMQLAHSPRADAKGGQRIGLVWMTRPDTGGDVLWHNGMTGGYASFMGFRKDGSRGVVILTNIASSVDDLGFAALLDDAPLAPVRKQVGLDKAALDEYTGSYRLAPGFILKVFSDDDQLYAQATGQGPIPMYASARDEFFAKVADISLTFKRDAPGKISSLVLHQNGDHPAPRLSADDADSGPQSITLKPVPAQQDHGVRYHHQRWADHGSTDRTASISDLRQCPRPLFLPCGGCKDRFRARH